MSVEAQHSASRAFSRQVIAPNHLSLNSRCLCHGVRASPPRKILERGWRHAAGCAFDVRARRTRE